MKGYQIPKLLTMVVNSVSRVLFWNRTGQDRYVWWVMSICVLVNVVIHVYF